VRTRACVAAVAGVAAAATGHALDVSGRLPFVHESGDVRLAMQPLAVVVWLSLAAALAAFAATTRLLLVGVPAALLVSATPELWGRGDPGALLEPGALLGAALQVLLLLVLVSAALVVEAKLRLPVLGWHTSVPPRPPLASHPRRVAARTIAVFQQRGPPLVSPT
jgi:hypothetical protein